MNAMTVSNEYGHVDEDGNVFLNSAEGPVKIAQYTIGDSAEGLAFFTKRFDDLVAEIELTAARLTDGKASVESVKALIDRIAKTIESPNMLGNLDVFAEHTAKLNALLDEQKQKATAAKAQAKAAAVSAREALVAEAEALANSTAWKVTGEKYKELLDKWKSVPNVDRGVEQELWKRFSSARSVFDKARRTHFAALDAARTEASGAKRAIIAKAAELAESTEWATTTTAFKKLMDDWKGLARAGKSEEEKLWAEFKAAQDKFFTTRNSANDARDEELTKNLVAKQELALQAEALLPIKDLEATKVALRDIASKWESIGHVPRNDKERIERRLKKVEDEVRGMQEEIWRRSKPEVIDRANTLVTSFEASIAKLEASLATAEKAGDKNAVAKLQGQIEQAQALLDAARSGASQLG
jgi:Domain of Unknown Function (DUF349)